MPGDQVCVSFRLTGSHYKSSEACIEWDPFAMANPALQAGRQKKVAEKYQARETFIVATHGPVGVGPASAK